MYYAISTLNDSSTQRTGFSVFGTGETPEAAEEAAADVIGGRDQAKTMTEATLYRNLIVVEENELKQYGAFA